MEYVNASPRIEAWGFETDKPEAWIIADSGECWTSWALDSLVDRDDFPVIIPMAVFFSESDAW